MQKSQEINTIFQKYKNFTQKKTKLCSFINRMSEREGSINPHLKSDDAN